MRLNQIRDLLAVADAGSIRAAALRVGISQPAMSKSLALLELEFQAPLFSRTSRGVNLTAFGRAFVARARVIQSELLKVPEDLASLRGNADGTVAFGIGPAASVPLVPDAMARFRLERPRARVRIREGTRNVLLPLVRDETLDFAIAERVNDEVEPGMRYQPLLQPELVIAARKDHPLEGARSLADLADAPWLVVYPLGSGGVLERTFSIAGLPVPNTQVHCESHAIALALIARGDLLGLVLRQIVDEPMVQRFIQRVSVREKILRPQMGIFMRADTPPSPTTALMIQALTRAARSMGKR